MKLFHRTFGCVMCLLACTSLPALANEAPAERMTEDARLLSFFVDRCLGSLDGRDWLLCDLQMLEPLESRARERGISVTMIPVVATPQADAPQAWQKAVAQLSNESLSVAAELGPIVFIREWMRLDPQAASRRLALMLLPDLWESAGLTSVPNGMLFLGAPNADDLRKNMDSRLTRHQTFWDQVSELLVMGSGSTATQADTRMRMRRQVGWVANNLGVALQQMGRTEQAFEVYTRARALDPQNLSAILNRAVCVKQGVRPELAEIIGQELAGLGDNQPEPRVLWGLTQVYGKVLHPEEFVQIGWLWALSGIQGSDRERWVQALESVPAEHREAVRRQLEGVHAGQTGGTDGEMRLMEAFADPEKRGEAWVVLARHATAQGRHDEAERRLQQAARAGLPPVSLTVERANLLTARGDRPAAREMLEKAARDKPDVWQFPVVLSTLYADLGDAEALESAIAKLETMKEVEPYHLLVARGRLLAMQGKHWQARDSLLKAIEQNPNAVFLYEIIIQLDFALSDKQAADRHADALLRAMPAHAFANYVKASLLQERKQYEQAEPYYRRSLESSLTAHALNDYAVLLTETRRPQEGERLARRALEMNDQMPAIWDTLATALHALGREDEAFAALQAAIRLPGSDDPRIQLHWAKTLHRRGDTAGARAAAEKAHAERLKLDEPQREELRKLREALP